LKNESLANQLKVRTLSSHQQLEKALVGRMRNMRTREDYISLLQAFYSYFGAIEDQINRYIGKDQLPDHTERRKTASLVGDIESLGGGLPEKAREAYLPPIENQLQAFGALYVIEGSTLGGLIISKMIAKQLGLTEDGLSFFKSYGHATNEMWERFKAVLNLQGNNDTEKECIIHAADDTFTKFKVFLDKQ
jgi:heme oxygenase